MKTKFPTGLLRPILAMLPPLIALILQWMLWSVIKPYVWFLFYPAVFFSSWIGGMTSGMIATAISTALVWWFFIPPEHSFMMKNPQSLLSVGVFIGMGALFSFFHGRLRKANKQAADALAVARSAQDQLEDRVKERTAALSEREGRLSSIYDTVGDVIFHLAIEKDGSYRFLSVNQAFVSTTGIDSAQVVGKLVNEIIPEPSLTLVLEKYKEAIREKKIVRWEETSDYPTGRLTGEVSVAPAFDDDGNCTHLVGGVHDITERKRAEEALLNAEKRYRTTLDHMLEGCQIIGFDWRYLYINDVAAKQGRHSKEELLGRTMMEIYPGIEHTQMFLELRRCMKERIPHRMENEFTFPDDSKGWFHLSMEPVSEGVFILSQDITKEKQLDEELSKHREHLEELVIVRTAQLEAANKELEAFSYSVSHDLRAPLRHIEGFIELLQKRIYSTVDQQSRRYLSVVTESTKKMGTLIDDLLAFSRMGRTEMLKSRVDIERLVNEVIQERTRETGERLITWNIGKLPIVECDLSMLRLVLANLISNALKFTRERTSTQIEINCHASNQGETVFFIRDNGVGFDMKYVDKLFGVFQRLHSADEFEGTGIGLANVRRIIHRHGGRTWAESSAKGGATFYFSLPKSSQKG